ncbi:TIGR02452 family protein [Singulisphaera sp. GP187]|uniref:TIGR02452 family protein n=1 Tax=Singulisphaera sp. GP187 TaxID=1882752 RepID=UPI00092BCA91|nr:TIGR02452 family protein [Singulisphaera sp. GP187]SIO65743.1 TIGR02452 family protein [Singulisphaera sp. GP187]
MKRSTRAELARGTVEIVERGTYRSASGRVVDIANPIRECLDATRYYPPEELERLQRDVLGHPRTDLSTVFEVVNETTLSGIARVRSRGQGPVAVLNFASAKNPGGGFLNGSHAQEESLARSSALHASQLRTWDFYARHRASSTPLYSDAMILSPGCPIIRDDEGTLLDEPQMAAFITSAAPNAGAAANNRPTDLPSIPGVFRRRSEYVLALAASQGYRQLVLGAWGCGVFRNDPGVVAESFAAHLRHGNWSGRFDRVVFSVLDTSPSQATLAAFRKAFKS